MKILMISTDRNLFDENSEVRQRIIEYGSLVEELHIIVKTPQAGFRVQKFNNVFLYPTNSPSRWFFVFDAIKIGRKITSADLITAQDPFECGLAGWFLKRKLKIPLQLQVHTDFLSPYFWRESLLNKLRVLVAKFLIPKASCIRVVSQRIKDSILGRLNLLKEVQPPITVLPIWADTEKIKNTPINIDLHKKYPQFDFIILMASRLTREKNITLAIHTMSDVVRNYPKTGLIIVGEGPEKENLMLQASSFRLSENIIFEPWTDDLPSYYKSADLFLLTSNYEGYGRTLIEAAAASCNIISTDVGVASELLEKENIVAVGDKQELKLKLTEAIRGNIKKARQQKLYSKEEYLKEYKKLWQNCIAC